MSRLCSVPVLFLFIGSLLGVFLRWQFILPTPGVNYAFFLHGHSHVLFLGWVFNAIYINFTINHIPEKERAFFVNLFYALQVLTVGMLISFPIQGYGFFSILFSTLHTIGAIVFSIKFFGQTKYLVTPSVWYARVSLVFFLISTAGPFYLGYLMANGMGQSNAYYFSIYFYLHFQYNGFFLFAAFSMIFGLLEAKKIQYSREDIRRIGMILAITCMPAYVLSILWAKPGHIFNLVGGVTGGVQLVALGMLIKLVVTHHRSFKDNFYKASNWFLLIVLASFAIKLTLQLLSASPGIAQMAYELRPVVIAYLHLALLGIISLALLVWFLESNRIGIRSGKRAITMYVIAFVGLELCLVFTPWWSAFFEFPVFTASECAFFFSGILSLSCFLLCLSSLRRRDIKG